MDKKPQILSVGEVLLDFVALKSGVTLEGAPGFVKCAGGAPANVAVGIARLGTRSAFIGNVGADSFGRYLVTELMRCGVETRGMTFDPGFKTRLAFVSLKKNGDRDFEFWENHPADQQLRFANVNRRMIRTADIVNIGPFLLVRDPSRTAAMQVAEAARAGGNEVCFDPNLRLSLWRSAGEARRVLIAMIRRATIVRMNADEARFLTGIRSVDRASEKIRSLGPRLVVVTLAEKGCAFQSSSASGYVPGFRTRAVDTTGCGDGFLAGLLDGLVRCRTDVDRLTAKELHSICAFANAVGALVATRRGAIAAMPARRDVVRFLVRRKAVAR